MRKHLYFNSSNMEQIRELKDDPAFEFAHEYPPIPDRQHQHQYEYGRLKTAKNYFHFIMGNPPQDGCPWCAGPCEIIESIPQTQLTLAKFCVQCKQCGARGPTLNVSNSQIEKAEVYSEIVALLWQRFKTRRPWDHGFINRYEQIYE